MSEKALKILVAAGGTGGHLFPALAVAEKLEKLTEGRLEAVFVGSRKKIEARTVPEKGYDFIPIPMRGFYGIFNPGTFLLPLRITASILKCSNIIKKRNIDLVLCTGAYLSYPAGAAASQAGIPLVLMESNVLPGKSIRLLTSKANLIITSFNESIKFYPSSVNSKIVCCGNPVRESIGQSLSKEEALIKLGMKARKKTVLVFGGSLGARSINTAVEKILADNPPDEIQFIWQTGSNFSPSASYPDNVKIFTFINDMSLAYSAADLVVSRSGATSVAEICVAGKPAILIPLPTASNNEQEYNASILTEHEAALMLNDSELEQNLRNTVFDTINNDILLKSLSSNVKSLAKPEAALHAAQHILKLLDM